MIWCRIRVLRKKRSLYFLSIKLSPYICKGTLQEMKTAEVLLQAFSHFSHPLEIWEIV